MKRFPNLKTFVMKRFDEHADMHDARTLAEKPDLVSFMKYLYSVQTVHGVFLEVNVTEVPKRLTSLFKLLEEKQLQNTTFELEFRGYNFQNDAVVFNFTRNDSRTTIFIMLDVEMQLQSENLSLIGMVGSFLYRLHLKKVQKDLDRTLNMISAYCRRLNCLVLSNGGDLDYAPSNEAIIQLHTLRRLELRDYHITVNMFALIWK